LIGRFDVAGSQNCFDILEKVVELFFFSDGFRE
jgi:hypothetical protein